MKLTVFDKFVLLALICATVVNIFSDYLLKHYFIIPYIVVPTVLFLLLLWVIVFISSFLTATITAGRYAVEALVLNDQNELLLYFHPHHRKFLPPGGRVSRSEFPHEAVRKRLAERIGLVHKDYSFHLVFHQNLNTTQHRIGKAEQVPTPFLVQQEFSRQRLFVKSHYDFFYVLKLEPGHKFLPNENYKPVKFADLQTITNMVQEGEIFPDVLDAYKMVLDRLAMASSTTTASVSSKKT